LGKGLHLGATAVKETASKEAIAKGMDFYVIILYN
jgi:hypothetical protein